MTRPLLRLVLDGSSLTVILPLDLHVTRLVEVAPLPSVFSCLWRSIVSRVAADTLPTRVLHWCIVLVNVLRVVLERTTTRAAGRKSGVALRDGP